LDLDGSMPNKEKTDIIARQKEVREA
jgi:hypothetical protein